MYWVYERMGMYMEYMNKWVGVWGTGTNGSVYRVHE